ncbi:fumarylacetoacetate hydrolase family protein [Brevibacterium casei]|uniref:fumarylacetoacetate hydrolase family protein n=1 Tax=Brevibacterium casei TaxID=33889 RepID=UPI0011A2A5E1|nr:fumarylacetoacetate hydrolase family protein [Brevibacterium casei]
MSIRAILPAEATGTFLGRLSVPGRPAPVPVLITGDEVRDVSAVDPTLSGILETPDLPRRLAESAARPAEWSVEDIRLPEDDAGEDTPVLLAPIDLQVIKACGVTFAGSMVERLIEERCDGDPGRAQAVRDELASAVTADLAAIVPGSEQASRLKEALLAKGWWSQYLEVGIGPDPEVFTKGPVLSAVGTGDAVGIPAFSEWSNPEPELVLVVDSHGEIRGVTMGNDVNLRDVEGRSALLLGMAKDNNRSTAIGPLIRLFDDTFDLDAARALDLTLTVTGDSGYELRGVNSVRALSRPFEDLVAAAHGRHHQYPDGFVLFTGTLFAPTEDRGTAGLGFTHHLGDRVTIASDRLGVLANTVGGAEDLPTWDYGIRALFRDLAAGQR